MEEFKGTKGEWKANGNNIQVNPENPEITESICLMYGGGNEKIANAKLIAAAPNLLHRLNSLILSVKAHPDYVFGEDGDEWHDLISLSEEAINKALK